MRVPDEVLADLRVGSLRLRTPVASWVQAAAGIDEYTLNPNGLKILLAENHSKPVVTVMVVCRVGSSGDGEFTGISHHFEHLMFKGTKRHDPRSGTGVMDSIRPLGSMLNATTNRDRTNFWECVPSDHLELCLELEADRLQNLNLREEDLDSERTVVLNEIARAQNQVDRIMLNQMYATAFREHPYRHPVLGWDSDIETVTIQDFVDFKNDYYWPNNCTIIVSGDFQPANALGLIAKHFGKIARSPKPIPEVHTVESQQEGERRFEIRRAGDLPRVYLGFHVPEARHQDTHALKVLAALLGHSGNKTSRLYKRLVASGLASSCSYTPGAMRYPGLFMVYATVAPGKSALDVEAAFIDELSCLSREPVSDTELERVKTLYRKSAILHGLDPMSRSDQIAQGEAVADWRWFVESDSKVAAVTGDDVIEVAGSYFCRDNRTVGLFIPKEKAIVPAGPKPGQRVKPTAQPEKRHTFASQVVRRVLSNRLTVNVMPNKGSGAVSVAGRLPAGDAYAGAGAVELLPTLTAGLLTAGTTTRSQDDIYATLVDMASQLVFSAERFDVAFRTPVVVEDVPAFIHLLGDMLRNPVFPEQELKRLKMQWQATLRRKADDTEKVAINRLSQALYRPGSPYFAKPLEVQMEELDGVTSEEIRAFYAAHYSPKGMVLTIVGDIESDDAFALVEDAFGDWVGGDPMPRDFPVSQARSGGERIDVKLEDKRMTSIMIGLPADVSRGAADFLPAHIANSVLGGHSIVARLGKLVRDEKGLSYTIRSQFGDTTNAGGPWIIGITVDPANIEQNLALVHQVVNDLRREGITDEELKILTDEAANGYTVGLRSDNAVAGTLTWLESLGLGVEAMDRYADQARSVTKKEVNAAIEKYFRIEDAVTVVAGTF